MALHINWPVELHPMLVHFPIALLCFAFFLDGAAWLWKSQSARSAALYALAAGAATTALSVVSGLITPEAREREGRGVEEGAVSLSRFFSGRLVEVHRHWSYVLLVLVILWLIVRTVSHIRASRWHGVAMGVGVLTLIALLLTGYYGGDIVYGRRDRERGLAAPAPRGVYAVPARAGTTGPRAGVSRAGSAAGVQKRIRPRRAARATASVRVWAPSLPRIAAT